ncbi:MAG: PqqD family protein [Deltaproteobacteria bacterium]|nr:PqqD family protein [Deltaproteobacteria bacterium]
MNGKKVFQFKQNARFYNFDESSFVIDISDHTFYSLGKSSALMAAGMDGETDINGIIHIIRQYYRVSPEDGAAAVEKFMTMMLNKPLIEEVVLG